MANGTRSAVDLEILLPSGVVVPLMLDMPRDRLGQIIDGAPKSLTEALEASDSDTPASEQLEPAVTDTLIGGVGVDYEAAEGVDCRTDGYAFPGGAATDVTITALNTSNSPIHAIAEYGGDLFVAQFGSGAANTGRILRSVGGTAAFTNGLNLGANEYIVDLCVFSDFDNGTHLAKNTTALYACSNDLSGLNGRLHKWDGTSWTSTAAGTFGTNGRYRLAKYFGVTSDGTGGWRLGTLSGPYSYSYTIPNADPMQATSWVEGVHVESTQRLQHLVASRRRVFLTAPGELFTIDEQGNSHSLTSYSDQTILPSVSGSFDPGDATILYHEGFVYVRLGTGLDRIDVDGEVLQETPGQCGPGWGTPVENRWAGFATCLASDQGQVVCAVWSPNTSMTGIFWGKDARHYPSDVQSRTLNPLIWHGPIVHTQGAYRVMRMHVSGLGTQLKLWISALSSTGVPALSYVSLPSGGNPLQDLMSAGPHRYADGAGVGIWQPYSSLYGRAQTFGNRWGTNHVYQQTIGSRGLGTPAGTKLIVSTRADPAPGSTAWFGSADVTVSPTQSTAPTLQISGSRIETRIDFLSPSGAATPPKPAVLDVIRTRAWRAVPDMQTWTLPVWYGAGVPVRGGGTPDPETDPTAITGYLRTAAQSAPVTIRDARGLRYTAKILQVVPRDVDVTLEGSGQTVRAKLKLADIQGPL